MTLTDQLVDQLTRPLLRHLEQVYASTCRNEPVVIDALSLVYQPMLDAPFELVARVALRPSGLQTAN